MKIPRSSISLLALPALALLGVSCGSKDDPNANPYASNPYYGPQTYGNADQSATATAPVTDGGYVAPAPDYNTGYTAPAPAPAAPSTYAPASYGAATTHTVSRGDTLFSLSRRYGTTVTALKSANGLNSDLIRIGQRLNIPG